MVISDMKGYSLIPKDIPQREQLLKRLRNVEVWSADRVALEWVVTMTQSGYGAVTGLLDSGRAAITSDEKALRIYLANVDIKPDAPSLPLELVDYLSEICGLAGNTFLYSLLQFVLNHNNEEDIKDTLNRKGIFESKEADITGEGNCIKPCLTFLNTYHMQISCRTPKPIPTLVKQILTTLYQTKLKSTRRIRTSRKSPSYQNHRHLRQER